MEHIHKVKYPLNHVLWIIRNRLIANAWDIELRFVKWENPFQKHVITILNLKLYKRLSVPGISAISTVAGTELLVLCSNVKWSILRHFLHWDCLFMSEHLAGDKNFLSLLLRILFLDLSLAGPAVRLDITSHDNSERFLHWHITDAIEWSLVLFRIAVFTNLPIKADVLAEAAAAETTQRCWE